MAVVFKRKLYDRMLQWKNERKGSTALLIKGARRVGKSTLVEDFAKREYKSYILIDFAETSTEISELFENTRDLDFFFFRLQNIYHTQLYERESVIIFDEVQLQPLARQAIKYLVKDGRYDFIETGSLLSIKKNVKNILIPSEETRLTLYPMDFEEFRMALGDTNTFGFMREAYEMKRQMGQAVHRQWMRDLRLYMVVGGMPQAVDTYLNTNNLQFVDDKKREIIQLYDDDFRKIDDSGVASRMFIDIPSQLSGNANRFMISSATDSRITESINLIVKDMEDSMVVNLAYHANDPNVGMGLNKDYNRYKMFMNDTGLFLTLAFWDKSYTENTIYQKLLSDKINANLGYVYENLIAQMLRAEGNELYYYTFPDGNNHNYEVDFLLSRGSKIVPIEVKSSGYKSHKSLDEFCKKFSSRIGERILLYTKDYQKDGETTCLPSYFAPFI
ncbi:MAG: ATP-binding protein [Salinivirgaceae bacterium]|nr:ATP-binding protein [Salinivirgaceae bacterium]